MPRDANGREVAVGDVVMSRGRVLDTHGDTVLFVTEWGVEDAVVSAAVVSAPPPPSVPESPRTMSSAPARGDTTAT